MAEFSQRDRTIALVGIYQAAQLVHTLATTGQADENAFHTCIQSLFCENPDDTLDVYGGELENIQVGVHTLLAQMQADSAEQMRNIEITRYVLGIMILESKLVKLDEPLDKIWNILETAKSQQAHFGEEHENVIASLARAYTENVSNVNPRIMVNGQHGHLQNARVANKIRALLLAGIRSSMLWHQVGGTRWNLIWSRKKYMNEALTLLLPSDSNTDDTDNEHTSYFKQD